MELNNKFKRGIFFSLIGQGGYLVVTFLTNIVFARLLLPKDIGTLAIAMFFVSIAKVISESGLGGALVREKNVSENDLSTVFIFNISISFLLYILFFFVAEFISIYYGNLELKNYIRFLSLILLINSFQIIQSTILIKELRFKEISNYSLISVVISSLISIVLGLLNFKIWALMSFYILNSFILTCIYFFKVPWKFKLVFSIDSFKNLYKFGINTSLASIINSIYDNLYQMVLARNFTISDTGYFYQAKKLSEVPVGVIKSASLGVVFSTLSKLKDDLRLFEDFRERVFNKFSILLGFICLIILTFSEEIIVGVYGSQWIKSIFFLQVLIISYYFYIQEMFIRIIYKIFNRTDILLKVEVLNKIVGLFFLMVGLLCKEIDKLMYGFFFSLVMNYFISYINVLKVYKSDNSYIDFIHTMKIGVSMIVLGFMFIYIIKIFSFSIYLKCLLLPLLLLIYSLVLKKMNIWCPKEDLIFIKQYYDKFFTRSVSKKDLE